MRATVLLSLLVLMTTHTAAAPPREQLDRGLIARPLADGKVYVGWRLLQTDPDNVAFDVYRSAADGKPVKLNQEIIHKTTDFVDDSAPKGVSCTWSVRAFTDTEEAMSRSVAATPGDAAAPYVSMPIGENRTFQKVGIADLDGDRRYDFVIKGPNANIDPWYKYWKRSPETYKLEAYRHDGKLLWQHDLGWAIERGIWYSPYVVYDLDGDGRAEVAVKTGEGDPRGEDGKVRSGPEFLAILDGVTGKPRTQAPWPSREGFSGEHAYNYYCRNQLAVAYLDGKHPHLLVQRGTYGLMKLIAYRLRDGELHEVWQWDNRDLPRSYWGQGAHWMHAADVDGDGREEVLLGSSVIDDDGTALWTTGLGHPDHFYVGDIDPQRPGLEIYYGIEPRRSKNTMCLVDAKTGEVIWGHQEPTIHIHSSGLCSDIDAASPGSECYSGERDFEDKRWLRDCRGRVLSTENLGGLAPRSAYWDADLQRELVYGQRIRKYKGLELGPKVEGHIAAVADVLGDWREEIVTSVPGGLRIYTTTIPAADRRACLMQDPIYRSDVICAAMGYSQVPMTGYDLGSGRR